MSAQYTIRDVPDSVDQALRLRAIRESRSIDAVVVDALLRGLDMDDTASAVHHDLDEFSGSWKEDPGFDKAVADLRQIDPEDWK